MGSFKIEKATTADLDAIDTILRASLPSTWTRQMMAEEIERPMAWLKVLRLSEGEPAVALVDCWLVADELHVLNLATHPDHRRRGYARRLMQEALAYARDRGAQVVTLELRQGNMAARRLYDTLGFEAIGVRTRYYQDTGEDAVIMVWRPPKAG